MALFAAPAIPAAAQSATAPGTSPAPVVAVVEGRVNKPTEAGEVPVPGVMVTVHRVAADSSGPLDSVRTDAQGRYRVRYTRFGSSEAVYFAASVYNGIAYFSPPLRRLTAGEAEAEIVVFDTTTHPLNFTIQGHHYVIGAPRPDGAREVIEVYEISNDTVVTAVGRDTLTAVWSTPLQKGATGFAVGQGDVNETALQVRNDSVVLLAPVGPGVKQLSFSYTLAARAFPLEITLDRPRVLLEVLLEEPGAQVRSPSLKSQGDVATQGRSFKRFLAQNAPRGERVRIEVPSNAAAARTNVLIGLAIVVVLAMVGALWIAFRRGQTPARAQRRAAPIADDGVDALAAAIAALDARHEAADPALSERAYAEQRAALKSRLAAALAAEQPRA